MNEKQRTFGEATGHEPIVEVRSLPTDLVECSDGTVIPLGDVYLDCRENPHRTEDQQHDANVEIVEEVLNGHDEWVTEYCTENTDYADGYIHIVNETSHDWDCCVEEWLDNRFDDPIMSLIVEAICEALEGEWDVEAIYHSNEYARYSGDGCCLWGTDIGEYENQIELSGELEVLHKQHRLDDVLDDVNCDTYVSRSKRRVKNEETGRYEEVGRATYGPDAKYPHLMTYHNPGGRWDFVVPAERMEQLLADAIVEVSKEIDSK